MEEKRLVNGLIERWVCRCDERACCHIDRECRLVVVVVAPVPRATSSLVTPLRSEMNRRLSKL